jgi:hypothetical protein
VVPEAVAAAPVTILPLKNVVQIQVLIYAILIKLAVVAIVATLESVVIVARARPQTQLGRVQQAYLSSWTKPLRIK